METQALHIVAVAASVAIGTVIAWTVYLKLHLKDIVDGNVSTGDVDANVPESFSKPCWRDNN